MLTQEEIRRYYQDGYVVPKDYRLPGEVLDQLRRDYDNLLTANAGVTSAVMRTPSGSEVFAGAVPTMVAIFVSFDSGGLMSQKGKARPTGTRDGPCLDQASAVSNCAASVDSASAVDLRRSQNSSYSSF